MLETKCVGDNFKILETAFLVTNIHYLFTLGSGPNIQKMSSTSKLSYQHSRIVTNFKSPTSLLPLTLVRIEQLTYTVWNMMFQTSALLHTSGSKFRSDWPNPGFSSKAIMYFPSTRFWSQRAAVEFAKAFHIAVFESLLICINLSRFFSDTAMSPARTFRLSTVSKQKMNLPMTVWSKGAHLHLLKLHPYSSWI